MKKHYSKANQTTLLIILFCFLFVLNSYPCSTFKLQKDDKLVYGHNLNEGDIGVPGMIFLNKRGIFKTGRTWSEITTKEKVNPSSLSWISRYGSVTFNNFGRDFPDGGMNETGLFIWEMNEDADYPTNTNLPKLNQMNWMQFILDNYSTVEEAIQCASEIEIDGWGWHFFVGDKYGNTAAIAFVDGKPLVYTGENMPIPGLFNTPYKRELELLKYYKGFGGLYEPTLTDPEVPRFVKTAVMIRDFNPTQNIVDYGLKMLETLQVNDVPEWSILFDAKKGNVYFKTRINPSLKTISMEEIDFSSQEPTSILNMDIKKGGDVLDQFNTYTNTKFETFTKELVFPIIPEGFYTSGGITSDEYLKRVSTHSDAAKTEEKQFFKGVWENEAKNGKPKFSLKLITDNEAVSGHISVIKGEMETSLIEHVHLIGNNLKFTFHTKNKTFIEAQSTINNKTMEINFYGIEDFLGSFKLEKKEF